MSSPDTSEANYVFSPNHNFDIGTGPLSVVRKEDGLEKDSDSWIILQIQSIRESLTGKSDASSFEKNQRLFPLLIQQAQKPKNPTIISEVRHS